jgi:hypothetical protein
MLKNPMVFDENEQDYRIKRDITGEVGETRQDAPQVCAGFPDLFLGEKRCALGAKGHRKTKQRLGTFGEKKSDCMEAKQKIVDIYSKREYA